ncbi:hypothetical protein CAPTEDRAFT_197710 [Capitella teleta]|uniref:Uncharacterized protein n=1 Tax=Capitella teleta TaxID=283909 RepID=R7TYQ3_CAPTE|nr:hypothetical protein CAPTEDRAFT_197710 [Capitella teleta]|eukprot:ELT99053.1 hypothetical protein CAPTEDRAFT_197710 [Capitella teleta]
MSQTAESTTVLIAKSTEQSDNSPMDSNDISTGVIVGAAVRCLAVLLEGPDASKTKHHGCDNLVILITEKGYIIKHGISRKRKSRAETPALDVANVSYGKVTKAEDNELTVIQTSKKDNEKKPNPKKEQKQKGEELEQETEENNKLTVVQNSEDGDEKKPNPKKEQKQKGKETEQETEEHNELTVVQTSEDDNKREPNPQKEEQKQKGKETEQETEEEDTLVIDNDLYGESIKKNNEMISLMCIIEEYQGINSYMNLKDSLLERRQTNSTVCILLYS